MLRMILCDLKAFMAFFCTSRLLRDKSYYAAVEGRGFYNQINWTSNYIYFISFLSWALLLSKASILKDVCLPELGVGGLGKNWIYYFVDKPRIKYLNCLCPTLGDKVPPKQLVPCVPEVSSFPGHRPSHVDGVKLMGVLVMMELNLIL